MNLHQRASRCNAVVRLVFAMATLAVTAAAAADLPALGGETMINTISATSEAEASVALDALGNYAVAYSRVDGGNSGIAVQRFFRNGTPNGALVLPNASTPPLQQDASISMANDGRFVVVWEDNEARGGNDFDLKYVLYSANGISVASGIVNATQSGVRENGRVSMNRLTGEFVVSFVGGASQTSVNAYYRRFSATGVALDATDKQVNSAGPERTSLPSVALAANGNFIVGWEGDVNGDELWEAYFQRYTFGTTAATAQGGNVVASVAGHDTTNVDVACDESGNFVLAWVDGLAFTPTEAHDLLYRNYNAAGVAASGPLVLKSGAFSGNGTTYIARIRVAMDDDQDFVATYLNNDEIYERYFNAAINAIGSEVHVNTTTNATPGEYQTMPGVAINPNGNRATVVWSGTGAMDLNGAYMQRYASTNTAPGLEEIGAKSVSELQELTFTAHAVEAANNLGDVITYSLTGTPPSGASINASTGVFTWTPTETQGPGTYSVTVKAMDNGEPALSSSETLAISVNEVNTPPSGLALSNSTVVDDAAVGTSVGVLSVSDVDLPAQAKTYSLVTGVGDGDNAKFNIAANQLQMAASPDLQTQTTMSVRVQASDGLGGTVQKQFTITIVPRADVDQWQRY